MPVKTKYKGAPKMANKDAVKKYQAKMDEFKIRPSKEEGAAVRAAAAAAGLSVQAFVLQAIREKIAQTQNKKSAE